MQIAIHTNVRILTSTKHRVDTLNLKQPASYPPPVLYLQCTMQLAEHIYRSLRSYTETSFARTVFFFFILFTKRLVERNVGSFYYPLSSLDALQLAAPSHSTEYFDCYYFLSVPTHRVPACPGMCCTGALLSVYVRHFVA